MNPLTSQWWYVQFASSAIIGNQFCDEMLSNNYDHPCTFLHICECLLWKFIDCIILHTLYKSYKYFPQRIYLVIPFVLHNYWEYFLRKLVWLYHIVYYTVWSYTSSHGMPCQIGTSLFYFLKKNTSIIRMISTKSKINSKINQHLTPFVDFCDCGREVLFWESVFVCCHKFVLHGRQYLAKQIRGIE